MTILRAHMRTALANIEIVDFRIYREEPESYRGIPEM